jgi:hypothetical protein
MKYTVLLLLFSCALWGQNNIDCFMAIKIKHDFAINRIPTIEVGDSIGIMELSNLNNETKREIVGCKYPSSSLTFVGDKIIITDSIKSDFVIINFNYLYGGNSLKQLDDLDSIKKLFKNKVTSISIFAHDKKEIQDLVNKYSTNIEFAASADEYIKYFNLGLGLPTTFILDKNKLVKYVSSGAYQDTGHLYKELMQYLKQ